MHKPENQNEQKKRFDTVVGILIASVLGFVLNLSANLYYDLFISKAVTWDKINHFQVLGLGLSFVGIIGFLQFFIDDYRNNVEMNKTYWKRFSNYFFHEFRAGRYIRVAMGWYLLFCVAALLLGLYFFLGAFIGYGYATVLFAVMFLSEYIKNKKTKS